MKIDPKEVGGMVERLREDHNSIWQPLMDEAATALEAKAAELAAKEEARAEQWRLRREAEASRDTAFASLTAERATHAETKEQSENRKDVIDSLRRQVDEFAAWRSQEQDAREAAEAQRDEALKALEPFAEIAGEAWADGSGWTNAACQNDRICDWFGPSAFRAARRVREGGKEDG